MFKSLGGKTLASIKWLLACQNLIAKGQQALSTRNSLGASHEISLTSDGIMHDEFKIGFEYSFCPINTNA